LRIIQITDLHLSDRTDTPAADALRWAIGEANSLAPDLVAFTGDMTTYGTRAAAEGFVQAAAALEPPWVFTPGNAERRDAGAMPVLAGVMSRRSVVVAGVRFLLPDTSTGHIPAADRAWLDEMHSVPCVILTHYPVDVLDLSSRDWIEAWLAAHPVELYLAGHRHFERDRTVGHCREIITQGLDPDKAFGGPPGISLLERSIDGSWSIQAIPWPHENNLLPAQTEYCPVGWSIHGDPTQTVRESRHHGLHVLELRPHETTYDVAATLDELRLLREERPVYLSWHLPNLSWDEGAANIAGQDAVSRQIDDGRACGVSAFTVHVPRIGAGMMFAVDGAPTAAWSMFLDCYETLFREVVAAGIIVSIENIHNQPGTPADRANREFATEIGEYLGWIDAVTGRLNASTRQVGAHFDVGHGRNNGALGNLQPLGDWYARIGSRTTGYHVHQVRPHEDTGKLINHREIRSMYDRTISYAGFLHAWSRRVLNRAPLFIEVRDADERRRTTNLFRELFCPPR
jgi:sugar phosphate isomerase/epimerase